LAVERQRHRVKLRRDAHETLRQRIVDLSRQPHALFQHECEAPANLADAQPKQSPDAGRRK
jgi:hypothetical protein